MLSLSEPHLAPGGETPPKGLPLGLTSLIHIPFQDLPDGSATVAPLLQLRLEPMRFLVCSQQLFLGSQHCSQQVYKPACHYLSHID